jgi:hypothetical protein
MIIWIIESIVLLGVFLGLDLVAYQISCFSSKESRTRAFHWLILIAFLLGEFWQVVVEHFK